MQKAVDISGEWNEAKEALVLSLVPTRIGQTAYYQFGANELHNAIASLNTLLEHKFKIKPKPGSLDTFLVERTSESF